ncbi:MAG: histidine kinase [Lachnospiraceae bacterium]|nr:histidine kinase [Lachnospiraceae bacterium]
MFTQIIDWGSIDWLEENASSARGLKAGVVTLVQGGHQEKHIHYEEQVIYVLEGKARCFVDGKESLLEPGDYLHWKAGIEHEVFNIGSGAFRHLMVSCPESVEPDQTLQEFSGRDRQEKDDTDSVSRDLIYVAIEAVHTQFLETLHYGYAVFDWQGNLILQSRYYPAYCVKCCEPEKNPGACACMQISSAEERKTKHRFRCEYGMEVFHYPILFRGVLLGYIHGGYIRRSLDGEKRIEGVYDEPDSVVSGIRALLTRVVKAITNYCEFEHFRRSMTERELQISTQDEKQRNLLKDLRDTQYAMTDLKINNHFLFNTLNSMASMALDEGAMALYQSIVDLSKMFHYTLHTQAAIVPLEKEMEYVKAYLKLQKLRYGEQLTVLYKIDRKLLKQPVPFNFLQPVVEKAFTHGCNESVGQRIRITGAEKNGALEIRVSNSGKKLDSRERRRINQGIKSDTSHGLSMLYKKLFAVYGEQFQFEIGRDRQSYTCFFIKIPMEKG